MNLPTLDWHDILAQSWKLLYGWQNGTRQHYVTLPGSTASYGEHTHTCTFENHCNLHTYQTNWPRVFLEIKFKGGIAFVGRENIKNIHKTNKICYSFGGKSKTFPPKGPEKNTKLTTDGRCTLQRMALKRYKKPRQPFSKLCSKLCTYCSNKLPEQGPTIAWLRVLSIMPLRAWAHRRFAYAQLSSLYVFYTLHVTHVINIPGPICFSVLEATESWAGPGNEVNDFLHRLLPFCIATFALIYVSTS